LAPAVRKLTKRGTGRLESVPTAGAAAPALVAQSKTEAAANAVKD
jgi:hypothetical protein